MKTMNVKYLIDISFKKDYLLPNGVLLNFGDFKKHSYGINQLEREFLFRQQKGENILDLLIEYFEIKELYKHCKFFISGLLSEKTHLNVFLKANFSFLFENISNNSVDLSELTEGNITLSNYTMPVEKLFNYNTLNILDIHRNSYRIAADVNLLRGLNRINVYNKVEEPYCIYNLNSFIKYKTCVKLSLDTAYRDLEFDKSTKIEPFNLNDLT